MQKKGTFTIILLTLSALSISAAAAYFSVYGLSKVFAGAGISVVIMASILEISKIITAYALHQNSKKLPLSLRIYLTTAIIVLMIITSAGIYGYLSNAYQVTANKNTIVEKEVAIIQAKIDAQSSRLQDLTNEKNSIVADMNNLRSGFISGTSIESVDRQTGQRVVRRDASITKALSMQLEESTVRRNKVDSEIDDLNSSIDKLKVSILEKQSNNDAAAELGPIIYLSKLTNTSMDVLINYFILLIVFVFDPLAISLVIALSHIRVYNIEKFEGFTQASSKDSLSLSTRSTDTENPSDSPAGPAEVVFEGSEFIEEELLSEIPHEDNESTLLDPELSTETVTENLEVNDLQVITEPGPSSPIELNDTPDTQIKTIEENQSQEIPNEEIIVYKEDFANSLKPDNPLPKLRVRTIKKEIPGYKIVDNGQKIPDIKEVEEVIIEPEEGENQIPLNPEEYAKILDRYVSYLENVKKSGKL